MDVAKFFKGLKKKKRRWHFYLLKKKHRIWLARPREFCHCPLPASRVIRDDGMVRQLLTACQSLGVDGWLVRLRRHNLGAGRNPHTYHQPKVALRQNMTRNPTRVAYSGCGLAQHTKLKKTQRGPKRIQERIHRGQKPRQSARRFWQLLKQSQP